MAHLSLVQHQLVLPTILACIALQLAQVPAAADTSTLLAFGHHKKNAEQDTTQNDTSNNAANSPTTVVAPGTIPGTVVAPAGMPPAIAPAVPPAAAAPILVAPTSMIDLNSGRFAKLSIDLQNAQFHDTSIDRANVTASEMDFRQGSLNSLNIDIVGGRFQQFIFDEMILTTGGNLHFDPNILLQEKVLQFSTPARADVSVSVSQDSLNKFLADPHTLANLSVTVSKRLGALASLFGAGVANLGVTMKEAHVVLNKGNKMVIAVTADLGMGGVGVPLSFEVDAQLGIKDGWVDVSDTHLMTNGQEISPQLSEMLVKKVNSLASWGHKSDDIQFDFTDIKVIPGKQFSVKGTAYIKRLRLTTPKEESQPQVLPGQPPIGVPSSGLPLLPNTNSLPPPNVLAPNMIPANQIAPK